MYLLDRGSGTLNVHHISVFRLLLYVMLLDDVIQAQGPAGGRLMSGFRRVPRMS